MVLFVTIAVNASGRRLLLVSRRQEKGFGMLRAILPVAAAAAAVAAAVKSLEHYCRKSKPNNGRYILERHDYCAAGIPAIVPSKRSALKRASVPLFAARTS